jgi:transposase
MSPQLRQKNIKIFERILADATAPEKIKRNATLRLSRLRAAAKRPAVTTRAATPAPMPTKDQIFEAVEAFRSLGRQRTALIGKRKSQAERQALATMVALMPAAVPQGSEPNEWRNFVALVEGLLAELKTLPLGK